MHNTPQVMYDKPDAPSNFTLKLRKHLRTRRLEDVRQLGVDRVVDFVFGCGDNAHHLILEMYAQVRRHDVYALDCLCAARPVLAASCLCTRARSHRRQRRTMLLSLPTA